ELTLSGTITNNGDAPLSNITIWWRMRTKVLTNNDVTQWFDEENDTKPLTLARHDLSDEIEPGTSEPYEMVIGAESSPFDYGSAPGPRGIELVVTATDDDGDSLRDHVRST